MRSYFILFFSAMSQELYLVQIVNFVWWIQTWPDRQCTREKTRHEAPSYRIHQGLMTSYVAVVFSSLGTYVRAHVPRTEIYAGILGYTE